MNVLYRVIIALLITLVALPVVAADPEPQSPTTAPTTPSVNQATDKAGMASEELDAGKSLDNLAPDSAMMLEIKATMDLRRSEISELAERAAGSPDSQANFAIQQEISILKQQTELDILAIQARYARSEGNEELALQIEAAIEAITSPPAPTAPVEERPAPINNN